MEGKLDNTIKIVVEVLAKHKEKATMQEASQRIEGLKKKRNIK